MRSFELAVRAAAAGRGREFDSATKPAASRLNAPDARKQIDKKVAARAKNDAGQDGPIQAESKSKIDDPTAVVSFLKKLVTPDKKPHKRRSRRRREPIPPSQVQPPQ